MRLITRYIACGLLLVGFFQSCKKGEDDPLLSLRTRKNRITGNWTLKSGYLDVHTENAPGVTDEHYEYSESDLSYKHVQKNSLETGVSHHLNIQFDKKGHFVVEEESNGNTFKAEGEWDFEDGQGKAKKKEYIQLKITSVLQGKTYYYDSFIKSNTHLVYRIKELRNKKLVLVSEKNMLYSFANAEKYWFESQYEFTQ
ncbi:MAG: hypothetical protein JNL60_07795 [Bacteroidia bacterium]|nr:hypothetical protein [Bacteroidia bacterium]